MSLLPVRQLHTIRRIGLIKVLPGLIVFRIWTVDRETAKFRLQAARRSTLQKVMRIIVESGLLYTIAALFVCCTYIAKTNMFYVASSIVRQLRLPDSRSQSCQGGSYHWYRFQPHNCPCSRTIL